MYCFTRVFYFKYEIYLPIKFNDLNNTKLSYSKHNTAISELKISIMK